MEFLDYFEFLFLFIVNVEFDLKFEIFEVNLLLDIYITVIVLFL